MPHVHFVQWIPTVQSVLPSRQSIFRVPIHHQRPMIVRNNFPRYLPVLQPPVFPNEYTYYGQEDDEEEEYQEEIINNPTVVLNDQLRTMTQQLPYQMPTLMTLQNYSQRQFTRDNRYVNHQYPLYMY